jgi:hypothetical protein
MSSLSGPFQQAWQELVGKPYSNDPIPLTEEELERLPTIILQFKGHDSNVDIASSAANPQLPLASTMDPANPIDVLLAVPPSHYMEYQVAKRMYVPGIYFEEADGSVLGANVLMSHEVLFDVENGRIGWVESSCDYSKLVAPFMTVSTPTHSPTKATLAAESKKRANVRARAHAAAETIDMSEFPVDSSFPHVHMGFCSSLECRLSVTITALLALLAAVSLVSRKRRRIRSDRSGRVVIRNGMPAPMSGSMFRSTSLSDSESPVQLRNQEKRGAVLRSRSYKPTSLSDDELQLPKRGRGFTRKAVLRARSSQVVL